MGRDRHNKLDIEAVKRRVIAGEEVTLAPSITARGKTIYLHIYYHGRCLKESLRLPLTHSDIEYAIKTLAAIRRSIELTGTFDYETYFPHGRNAHKFGTTTRVTVGQALLAWYETKQDEAAPSTANDYKNSINILIQSFADITVADLSVQPIQAWVNSRTSSNKRTRNVLTPLRGVLAAAYASRQIKENPLDRVVFPKPKPQQSIDPETGEELSEQDNIVHPFRYDEIEKILSACEALPLFYYYVMLAIATGMRTCRTHRPALAPY